MSGPDQARIDSYRHATTTKKSFRKHTGLPRATGIRLDALDDLEKLNREIESFDEHKIPLEDLYQRLSTDPELGLSYQNAWTWIEENGHNEIVPFRARPEWLRFLFHCFDGFNLHLWVVASFCLVLFAVQNELFEIRFYTDYEFLGIMFAVVVLIACNGVCAFWREPRGGRVFNFFGNKMPAYCRCLRNGQVMDVRSSDIAVGDIIEVTAGDRLPADIRIVSGEIKVDNHTLTGVYDPVTRNTLYTSENPIETRNLAFCTTQVTNGSARGIVIRCGNFTMIGMLCNFSTSLRIHETNLAKQLRRLVLFQTLVLFVCVAVLGVWALIAHFYWMDFVLFLSCLVLANVPVGLGIAVTIALALLGRRMSKENLMVLSPEHVDTLGAAACLLVDSGAFLAHNRSDVTHLWIDDAIRVAKPINKDEGGFDVASPTWAAMASVMKLCNRAETMQSGLGGAMRELLTDSTLLRFADSIDGDVKDYRIRNAKVCEIPFSSYWKYQVSVHELENDGYAVVMKGPPELIVDRCHTIIIHGREYQLDANIRDLIYNAYYQMGTMGQRVIALCDYQLPKNQYPKGFPFEFMGDRANFPMQNMRFIGLVGLSDPPRANAPESVLRARTAGMKVVLITEDHPYTAKAVARKIGIISEESETIQEIANRMGIAGGKVNPKDARACVVRGSDLAQMGTDDVMDLLTTHEEVVFASMVPEQKLRVVDAAQRLGWVTVCTGEAVNDMPALKKADVGVALGISGSEVAKQSADMIILDDNFSSIVEAVEQGRIFFENLKKMIAFCLMSNMAEAWAVIFFVVGDMPLPLGIVAILVIDCLVELMPLVALSFEYAESDVMRRPPRDVRNTRLVQVKRLLNLEYGMLGMICGFGLFFTFFVITWQSGYYPLRMFGVRPMWDKRAVQDLTDSYGQEWSYDQRKLLEFHCYGGIVISIVICQVLNMIASRTRWWSIIHHGYKNIHAIYAPIVALVVACLFIYVPYLNHALRFSGLGEFYSGLSYYGWLPVLPFALALYVFDEIRRLVMRRDSDGFLVRETYY